MCICLRGYHLGNQWGGDNVDSLFNLQVKLKDSLMSSVSFRQAKDAELSWIDGQIHFSSATSKGIVGLEGQEMEESKTDLIPVLDAPSHSQVRATILGSNNFIAFLKQKMQKSLKPLCILHLTMPKKFQSSVKPCPSNLLYVQFLISLHSPVHSLCYRKQVIAVFSSTLHVWLISSRF